LSSHLKGEELGFSFGWRNTKSFIDIFKNPPKLGMVAVPLIPATWGMEIRKVMVQGQPGKKEVSETPSQLICWV
jgi:hypothetical protein